ncbi:cupin domain-containing protein [Halomonas organivorans]|uniref:Anti-sigma factor ChrR (Cupin superfamily) n=1 Tax=Halomonas organivorans TaxID=257772 RepID=A0A7W5BV39_9GAMM|nr:anti-sigma factor ChrR (cupin superfamily) [Halomonas organivorans]
MNDIFEAPRSNRPDQERFQVTDTHSLDWQESGITGFQHKILYCDDSGDTETMLIRMAPGAFSDYHAHDRREQLYVIEGDFYDQNHHYRSGNFIVREPNTNHIAGSDGGGLVLLIFSR